MKQIGLFGGTFDPIHFGHLRAALEVQEAFALDETRFIPSAIPPHKAMSGVSAAHHRLAMIQLALSDYSLFTVSDIELKRQGPSYSIDTVDYLKSILSDRIRLFLIMGVDAFLEIHTWKAFEKLFQEISIVVMTRPSGVGEIDTNFLKTIGVYLKDRLSAEYHYEDKISAYIHGRLPPVHVFEVSPLDISSSKIRNLVKKGKSINFFLPDRVINYINDQGLYQ